MNNNNMNNSYHPTFGAALAAFLEETGTTPTAAARLAGLSHSTISRYISGDRSAKEGAIAAICTALGLAPVMVPDMGWRLLEHPQETGAFVAD